MRPGLARPLIAQIGCVQFLRGRDGTEHGAGKEDKKDKRKATNKELAQAEEEDREERDEEY